MSGTLNDEERRTLVAGSADAPEPMDVDAVVELLGTAAAAEGGLALDYAVAAASVVGPSFPALRDMYSAFAAESLADYQAFVERVCLLGGGRVAQLAAAEVAGAEPRDLAYRERATIDRLAKIIPHAGTTGAAEALEHLLEHAILRKQTRLDALVRLAG